MKFTMRFFRNLVFIFLLILLANTSRGERDWPNWVAAAASLPTPTNAAKAPAVVLFDETTLEVDNKGIAIEVHRAAVRILHIAGREHASGGVSYNESSDKVLEVNAWLLRDGKLPRAVKNSDWVDIATNAEGAVIDEYRSRRISLSSEALVNDVFSFETKIRRPLLVAQLRLNFGSALPVITERFSLQLPPGFAIDQNLSGPSQPAVTSKGSNQWTWTSSDRPYRPNEPLLAPGARVDAELIIRFLVPPTAPLFAPRTFTSWPEVTAMYAVLNSGQCDTSPELAAKARTLTAAAPDALAKIKVLGGYVQKIRYIEINQGLRYGFGWKARKASAVFANSYGDCKDKANLLIAMLREVGIRSHMVIAMVDPDQGFVARTDCPTPVQFNHAIAGIEVDETVNFPAVVTTEKSGRLLFFDPTDPYTRVGDLPRHLQGTKVHVATPESINLTLLPEFTAKNNYLIERQVTLTLAANGVVTAKGQITGTGQVGASLRHEFEAANLPKDLEQLISNQLSDGFRGAVIQDKKTEDDPAQDRTTLSFTCLHPRFIQRLQGNGTIVKLDVLSRRYLPNFSENERRLAIGLRPAMVHDEIILKLGEGVTVDEVPPAISFESPYGTYQASFAVEHDSLVMKRTVLINRIQVPADDYAKLRRFFSDIARADRSSVMLKSGS